MKIIWTQQEWIIPGVIALALIAVALYFGYRKRASMPLGYRWLAATLKWLGCCLLLLFILEPKSA